MNTPTKIHGRKAVLFLAIYSGLQINVLASDEICRLKVTNNLAFDRNSETVVISSSKVFLPEGMSLSDCRLFDAETGLVVKTQWVDSNSDGIFDEILFQPFLSASSKKEYVLKFSKETFRRDSIRQAYSRFVPERIDDYAWENDRVAFRTYGPEAQRLTESNLQGGTLTSGIDCWLKRVEYPIIDKWYKKYSSGTGTYHEDIGEGLDNFHVGASRGCGGIGIWDANTKILYASKNFTKWETIENGPIRIDFKLSYAPWQADRDTIIESKSISLDLGNQLSKLVVEFTGSHIPDTVTVGLTLHKGEGKTSADEKVGWFSYWEPIDDSEIGTGIVADPKYIAGYTVFNSKSPNASHLYVHLIPVDWKIEYYTGFAWKKAGRITNREEWNSYLERQTQQLNSPLRVEFIPLH